MKKYALTIAVILGVITGIGGCSSLVDQITAHDNVTPIPTAETTNISDATNPSAVNGDYMSKLRGLTISDPVDNGDYYRTGEFGKAWLDIDGDGCDERDEVLARDLTDTQFYYADGWCAIGQGILHDPYTGDTIHFVKGQGTSALVQIDHIVPLKYAWTHGANKWTQDKRIKLANDLNNLVAVKGSANSAKGASGPAEWFPQNQTYWCQYAENFISITSNYDISVSHADALQLEALLGTCAS